jgi:O-antigen ligase
MRYLLALLILALTVIDMFGLTQSVAPGLSVKNAILYVILLALSARFVLRGGFRMELRQVHLWFGILIAYAMLSWLAAGILIRYKFYNLVESGIALKANLLDDAVVFAICLYGTQTLSEAKFVLKCILLAVAVANAVALGNVAGVFDIGVTKVGEGPGNIGGRVFGAFGHANETAAMMVCLLPAYISAALSSTAAWRWLWGLGGVVAATLLVATGSRGGLVALALGTVFGLYICRGLISWRRAAALAAPVVAIAVCVLVVASIKFGDILTQRVAEMILDPGTSSDERLYVWVPVVSRMIENPITLITGFGWGAYDVMGFFWATHNHYLLLWFELGIIGLGSYLLLIRELLLTARRAAEHAPEDTARDLIAFVFGIIGLSFAVFFTLLSYPWIYVWMYIGVTMRMAVIALQTAKLKARDEPRGAAAIGSAASAVRRAKPRLRATRRSL